MTDAEWLDAYLPDFTDDELERFIERIGIKLDGVFTRIELNMSRMDALHELKTRRAELLKKAQA